MKKCTWFSLAGVFFLLSSCAPTTPSPTNIILLTLDTTRTDALSCYGGSGAKTPHLDRLAKEGVRFEEAYTTTPLTLPSHASILTGTYPPHHGARDNGSYRVEEENQTLAEVLGANGYDTAAFIASFPLDSRFGTHQGFRVYDDDLSSGNQKSQHTYRERRASSVVDSALRWFKGRKDGPFFMWLHFFDPHAPYSSPTQGASDPYLAEVTGMDAEIGRFLGALADQDALEETIILVVGDHGEGRANPHPEKTHGLFLYDETLRVPLLLHHPGSIPSGRVVQDVVSVVDIVPTTLELLDLPPSDCQGESWVPSLLRGESLRSDRAVYLETLQPHNLYGWSSLCGIRKGDWKYIRAPHPELYNLKTDPTESKNLLATETEMAAELAKLLDETRKQITRSAPPGFGRHSVDAKAFSALEALGYVTGSASDLDPQDHSDPLDSALILGKDPKDFISVVGLLDEARVLQEQKRFGECLEKTRKALTTDPDNRNALSTQAKTLGLLQRHREAEQTYRKLLKLDPNNAIALYGTGLALYSQAEKIGKTGDTKGEARLLERAQIQYLRAIHVEPFHVLSHLNLGNCYAKKKKYQEAQAKYEKVLELEPGHLLGHRNSASVLISQRLHREAIPHLQAVLRQTPGDNAMVYNLALCLEQVGNLIQARSILQQLQQLKPNDPRISRDLRRVEEKMG